MKRKKKGSNNFSYLLNRKTGRGILDFRGLVSPAVAVTGAGMAAALLLLPPVEVSLGFFGLSPHKDSHFCFSDENSSTFVSVLLLSGCCCATFDFFGDRPECCD